jgi:uncharacterized membrane protein HdeD (DUF308 family)
MSLRTIPSNLGPALRQGWWLFLIRGVLALALGIVAIVLPGATLAALILLSGAFFIVDGFFAVVKALRTMRSDASWWLLLISGILSVVLGVMVYRWPGETLLTLGYLIGFWAILTGILEVFVAIAMRNAIRGEWLYVVFGIISIAFGAYVTLVPGLGLAYLTILIAIYGFAAGISLIVVAFRLRGLPEQRRDLVA